MAAPWSQERRQWAVDLYTSGHSIVECMKIMHAAQQMIQKYLKQAGVEMRPAVRRPASAERRQQAVDLYLSGYSIAECCKALKATSETVAKFLKDAGIEMRFAPWTGKKIQKLVALYSTGVSVSECARQMGTNCSTIRKYLRQQHVKIRPHVEATKRGAEHGGWKGGRTTGNGTGYIYIKCPEHPYKNSQGYVLEHHLVMEKMLGRYLSPGEVVHHRDKNKQNNLPENLQLFSSNGEHLAVELTGCVPKWSEEGKMKIVQAVKSAALRRKEKRRKTRSKIGVHK